MGAVYEGEDAALRRKVAVKFLPDELLNKPDVIERFMREAWIGYIAPVTPQLILSNIAERFPEGPRAVRVATSHCRAR